MVRGMLAAVLAGFLALGCLAFSIVDGMMLAWFWGAALAALLWSALLIRTNKVAGAGGWTFFLLALLVAAAVLLRISGQDNLSDLFAGLSMGLVGVLIVGLIPQDRATRA